MQKVGVLVVSKCLSAAAIIDTLARSEKYLPRFYVVERQVNPHNSRLAQVHKVVPDLGIEEVSKFARRHSKEIAFGLTDTEDFVTGGGRDAVEAQAGVPMVCVTKDYAVEASKADQRTLFQEIFPEANPRYRVFDPAKYEDGQEAVKDLIRFSQETDKGLVIKPDAPARGAGVGVQGSDFATDDEMVAFFRNVYSKGKVVVEEKVEGEESSFQAFSDGKHFIPAPLTRDYKRSLDGNKGHLTGGMGSYRGRGEALPFLHTSDWESLVSAEERAFRKWRGRGSNPGLRGIVLYDAIMHTGRGFKVLERNSRGGNTEQINVLTTMQDDYIDVCLRTVEGALKGIKFSSRASVVTCAVPLAYGGERVVPTDDRIGMEKAEALARKSRGGLRIFPMDVRIQDGATRMGTSRTVAVAGIAGSTEEAREVSVEGVKALSGPLRYRSDVGSRQDIERSRLHLLTLARASR